jgi:peptidoglycan/LPS O-acetylase OafA/YrhL
MAIEHAEHVHSASGWAATAPKIETGRPLPVIKPIMFLAAFVLVLMCSASAWIYSRGTHDLRMQAQRIETLSQGEAVLEKAVQGLLTQAQDMVLRITVGTAVGGTGLLLAVLIGTAIHLVIEKPLLRWLNRRLAARPL